MLLALTIWGITLISVVLFAGRFWWFPESASTHGELLDTQFLYTLIVTGAVFILAQVGLGYAILRFRESGGRKATYSHGNDKMEVIWTSATTVVFYIMVLLGYQTWYDLHIEAAPSNAVRIEITGQQFAWNVRYPGPDGQFGATRPELMSDSTGNPLGLDLDDPNAQDDLVLPTVAVPVNRPVELLLRSKDVTHDFFVRELRIKQDAVPGMVIPLRFTANRIGRYEVACAELCGMGHHRMRTYLNVLSDKDYAQWLIDQSE